MQNILSPVPALACLLLLFAGKLDLKQHERAKFVTWILHWIPGMKINWKARSGLMVTFDV